MIVGDQVMTQRRCAILGNG